MNREESFLFAQEPHPPSQHLGPYELQGILGSGGMGLVYRANHRVTGQRVAVKTVRLKSGSTLASLRQEVRALSQIHHPGIVRIVDHELTSAQPWYAMELMEGLTLRQVIERYWGTEGRSSRFTVTPSRKTRAPRSQTPRPRRAPRCLAPPCSNWCGVYAPPWPGCIASASSTAISNPPTSSSEETAASSWETSARRPSSEAPTDARCSRWTAATWARPLHGARADPRRSRGCAGGPLLARLHPL